MSLFMDAYGPYPWRAWRPVRCSDGRVRWLCWVLRQDCPKGARGPFPGNATYSRLPGEYEPTPLDWTMRAHLAAVIVGCLVAGTVYRGG